MSAARDPDVDRRFARAHKVADAVLYEGYVLYPYRPSSGKNQVRWQFGVLAPKAFCETDASESCLMRTECVLDGGPEATVWLRVRFLGLRSRTVQERHAAERSAADDGSAAAEGSAADDGSAAGGDDGFRSVPSLEVGGRLITTWDEAGDYQYDVGPISIGRLGHEPQEVAIDIAAEHDHEILTDASGAVVGRVLLERAALSGRIGFTVTRCESPFMIHRLSVEVENLSPWAGPARHRDEVVRHSILSVHTLLAVESGGFVSQIDPPDFAKEAVAGCRNKGTFPVLVGDGLDDKLVLSSPIILYDHPEVAPESEGDMCDATEIDEILALRILTLTDEEKREARQTDARAAAIVDRCDSMPAEVWERLHGAIRSLRPVPPAGAATPAAGTELDARFIKGAGPAGAGPAGPGMFSAEDPFGAWPDAGASDWPGGDIPAWSEFDTVAAAGASGQSDAGSACAGGRGIAGGAADAAGGGATPWFSPEADKSVHPMRDTVTIAGVEVGRGTRVRLRPGRRADAQDLFLTGRTATVEGVLNDVDGGVHLALTLADDPAAELHQWYGRFLYFFPDECEPLPAGPAPSDSGAGTGMTR